MADIKKAIDEFYEVKRYVERELNSGWENYKNRDYSTAKTDLSYASNFLDNLSQELNRLKRFGLTEGQLAKFYDIHQKLHNRWFDLNDRLFDKY